MFEEDNMELVTAKPGDIIFISDFWLRKQKETYKNHHGMWSGSRPYLVLATGGNREKLFAVPMTSSVGRIADEIEAAQVRNKSSRDMPMALFCTTLYPKGDRHNGAIVLNCPVVVPAYSKYCHVPRTFIGSKLNELGHPSGQGFRTKELLNRAREGYNKAKLLSGYCPMNYDYDGVYSDLYNYCAKLRKRKANLTNPDAYDRWSNNEIEKIRKAFEGLKA